MRIAILGCGSIGQRHLRNLIQLGQRDLVVFDPMEAVRSSVAVEFDVATCERLEQVWDHAPAIILVTSPSNLHIQHATEAVRRGCHVFVEKPLSYALDGTQELLSESARQQRVTMVGCNMRFHPGPATVKRLLAQGVIGAPVAARIHTGSYLPCWHPQQDYTRSYSASAEYGGAVLDCIHEIDLALWYFGEARVIGSATVPARSIGLETDGLAEMILQHASGVLSSIHLNFVERDYHRSCRIIGCEGTISWDFGDRQVQVFGPDGNVSHTVNEPAGWSLNQMYIDELAHFLDAVADGRPTMNPLEDGLRTLRIAASVRTAGVRQQP